MRQHLQQYSISVSQVCCLVPCAVYDKRFLMRHFLAVPKNSSAAFDARSFCRNRKENNGKIINPKVRHTASYQPNRTEYFFLLL
jgi:hypothetical protein